MVASDESGNHVFDQSSSDDTKPQPPPSHNQVGESSKKNSILSLTLDEIQNKSGKSFGSMNMDEFLANIWSGDENQVLTEQTNHLYHEDPAKEKDTTSKPYYSRQRSFSISTSFCKKTVEEVWSEIDKTRPPPSPNNLSNHNPPQSQQTMGEITLENFLVKAGVVHESLLQSLMESIPMHQHVDNTKNSNMETNSSIYLDTTSGLGNNVIASGYLNPQNVVMNNLSENGYVNSGYSIGLNQMVMGETFFSTGSEIEKGQSVPESRGAKTKKRTNDGPLEVAIGWRQRRMIKNRESAARSRARKQAYTVELEAELNHLEDENTMLKETLAGIKQIRKEEIMGRKTYTRAQLLASKLRTVRRTVSA